jgi:ubiquinone/menaquinone biosynthesis C-methylase UbiE
MANGHSEYWSTVARKYDEVVDIQIGLKTRALVRERASQEGPLGTVVEFGAGTGYYTSVLAGKADSLLATDIAPGMLDVARDRVRADNVKFQTADCQSTGLPAAAFDTAFISLVIHFTDPAATIAEMHRVLKPGGTLIIVNLDMPALTGFNRLRCIARVVFTSLTQYRVRPPKGFGATALSEKNLHALLNGSGFKVTSSETIRDGSRSSFIPLEYVRATRI